MQVYPKYMTHHFEDNCNVEEIKIKCEPDESSNIIDVHELKEKHSSSIVLELLANSDTSICQNIVIDEEDEGNTLEATTCHFTDLQCFHCGLTCENLSQIEEHYNVHTLSKPFRKCEIGYECVASDSGLYSDLWNDCKSLENNFLEEHSTKLYRENPPFISPECELVNDTKTLLDEHTHSQDQERLFECCFCTLTFTKKRYFKNHLKLVHSNYKPFECKKCTFKCERRANLFMHKKRHSIRKPFKCSQCCYRSKPIHHLKTHLLSHNDIKPFHCAVCNYKCSTKYLLKDHYINYHTEEKPFKCSLCLVGFKRNGSLKRHMLTHTECRPYECHLCDYICNRKDNLRLHINAIHSDIKPFSCSCCSFACKFRITLKKHMDVHSLSNPFVCNKCDFRFNSEVKLKRHALSHTLAKDISCLYCSFKTKTKIDLQVHLESCRRDKRIVSCSECAFSCKRKATLKKHVEQWHSDPFLPYHCHRCPLKFKQESYFRLHILYHDSSTFYCPHCLFNTKIRAILVKHINSHDINWNYGCNAPSQLNIHIKDSDSDVMPKVEIEENYHSLDRKLDIADMKIFKISCSETEEELGLVEDLSPVSVLQNRCTDQFFSNASVTDDDLSSAITCNVEQHDFIEKKRAKHKCPECEERFHTKFDLKDHLTLHHSDYRPFKCDQCGQGFKIKANLQQHLVVHSDAKPYRCTICDYSSKLSETLRRHLVTHSTEKPFQCSLCKYRCKLKEKLKRHMIVHSDDRPFHCSQCTYTCKLKELLKKHAVVHTREKGENSNS